MMQISPLHHIPKGIYWIEIWWLCRSFQYSELIAMFPKPVWDDLTFVMDHYQAGSNHRRWVAVVIKGWTLVWGDQQTQQADEEGQLWCWSKTGQSGGMDGLDDERQTQGNPGQHLESPLQAGRYPVRSPLMLKRICFCLRVLTPLTRVGYCLGFYDTGAKLILLKWFWYLNKAWTYTK